MTSLPPAAVFTAAVQHLRTTGRETDTLLALMLERIAADALPCRCTPETCATQAALVVARRILGTTEQADTEAAPVPLSEVWTVWREDEPTYAHFATEEAAKYGTIDCWQEDEPSCPDYSWRQDGPRLELLVGGEHGGVYASRHRVYGTPKTAPVVDRATVLRERADFFEGVLRNAADPGSDPRYWSAISDVIRGLRQQAAEAQQPTPAPASGPCPECGHRICRDRTPCGAILSATGLDLSRCPCTGQPATPAPAEETKPEDFREWLGRQHVLGTGTGVQPETEASPVCGDRSPATGLFTCQRSPGHTYPHRNAKQKGTETSSWWGRNEE